MSHEDAALQEYQALRAEILAQHERRTSRFAVVWAAISALLVAGTLTQVPELACVALLVVCAAWTDETRWFDNMQRIGGYIRVILEPKLPGLQWEQALDLVSVGMGENKAFLKRLLNTTFSSYGILVISCLISSIVLFVTYLPSQAIRQIAFYILLTIGGIYSFVALLAGYRVLRSRKYWRDKFSEIADKLHS